MTKKECPIGETFGDVIVLWEAKPKTFAGGQTHRFCWCLCKCGRLFATRMSGLGKNTKSCGCAKIKHGMTGSPEYVVWDNIKQRCHNPSNSRYADYGGRGITMCWDWYDSYERFFADMGRRPKGCSIERIDNNKGYYKENCRWANIFEQQANTRHNQVFTVLGKTAHLSELARHFGIPVMMLWARIFRLKWTPVRACTEPPQPRGLRARLKP